MINACIGSADSDPMHFNQYVFLSQLRLRNFLYHNFSGLIDTGCFHDDSPSTEILPFAGQRFTPIFKALAAVKFLRSSYDKRFSS